MNDKYRIHILGCLCLVFTGLYACSSPQPVAPAAITVLTLNVSPQQVQAGGEVSVTAEVANTGGMPGNFDEPLLVNGKQADIKTITIQPGYSKSLAYTLKLDKSGKHTIQLGGRSASVAVTGFVEQDVEFKYDNDKPRDALWAGNNGGFLIGYDPPYRPFALKMVRICGGVYGTGWEGKSFNLMVLDSDMKSIVSDDSYVVAKFPVRSAFPYQHPTWVDFNMPISTFNNKFYIYLYTGYTGMGKHRGIHIGVDDSTVNDETSFLAQGRPPGIVIVEATSQYPAPIWYSDITRVNWMIRACGTALVPE